MSGPDDQPMIDDYWLCGWRLRSELSLPALRSWPGPAGEPAGDPDVICTVGPLPDSLPPFGPPERYSAVAADGTALIDHAVARVLISEGRRVRVEPRLGGSALEIMMLGPVAGFLGHQRGLLPLHGVGVARGGAALVLCGPTGAGKSSLGALLSRRGFSVLNDDVAMVATEAAGRPEVRPGAARVKLAVPVFEAFGWPVEGVKAAEGLRWLATGPAEVAPVPLAAVVSLEPDHGPDIDPGIGRAAVTGGLAAGLVLADVYRPTLARRMGRAPALLTQVTALTGAIRVWRLWYPGGTGSLATVADLIADSVW